MSSLVGVGIDLVDVDRFTLTITRRPALITRFFTEREVSESAGRPERLAARFAAKEAVLKVLGVGLGATALRNIEVCRAESGAPSLHLTGTAATLAEERSIRTWQLSLTHTNHSAGAVALGLS